MKKRLNIEIGSFNLIFALLLSCLFVACTDDADNDKRNHDYNMDMTISTDDIYLNENTPDDIALTLEWTPAIDRGLNYNITYLYEINLYGGDPQKKIEKYIDNEEFKINYTHKELQDLFINHWEQKTGRTIALQHTVTATYEGSLLIIPEIATSTVKYHLYGPKQFEAEKLFMSGIAVGDKDIELAAKGTGTTLFTYTGNMEAGTINFPIVYGHDEKVNIIGAETTNEEVALEPMNASISDGSSANSWVITEPHTYRITVDLTAKTVSIIPVGEEIIADKIYLAGTAVSEEIELVRTLENDNCFAFQGKLKAGSLYLPILLDENKDYAIVPNGEGDQDLNDGNLLPLVQATLSAAEDGRHWNIMSDDTYRVVLNIETKELTIYSSTTDLKPKKVSWNNTVIGQNPFVSEVTQLWIYGGYNNFAGDGDGFNGFDNTYVLTPSLASPYIFVYKGDVLPRATVTDAYGKSATGYVNFTISNIHNNVWAYGSTADAKRNQYNGYESVITGADKGLVAGQGDNRYAYFLIPENTNFVVVDIENLTVVFDHKE